VTWRSFELDPDAPHEQEGDRAARLAAKYGMTIEQAHDAGRRITEVAAGEGLDFHFDIARSGNTFDAHRVVHLAAEHGLADAMKERLLRAYFTEGELVSDHRTLVRMAIEVGIAEEEAREVLATERYAEEVRGDELLAGQLGIGAVPTFVMDRAFGTSGAQDPSALLDLLRRGWEARGEPAVGAVAEAPDGNG
jgi:predicted DsbA family dithiol-disulfide isomerase